MLGHAIDNKILLGEVRRLLTEGKQVKIRAKGNSMRPFIYDGDTIIIASRPEYLKGEIVLARVEDGRYVAHRIMGLTATGFVLMGDGNLYGQEYCSRKDVYGRVEAVAHNRKERKMLTKWAFFSSSCWRFLLPLRRLWYKIKKGIIDR